jgi:hypothetical protein
MNQAPPFSENDLRSAIAEATSWAQTQRLLGYAVKGANHRTVQRWARHWGISTGHFDPNLGRREACRARAIPLEEVLVENSSYHRGQLKARLLRSGLKQRVCELCGQDELWHGQRMSLVLDHVNGVPDDNRLENLRIICPNCDATLATHCGRHLPRERTCPGCGQAFAPRNGQHRYCSQQCWGRVYSQRVTGVPQPDRRKMTRPSYEQLLEDVRTMSMGAVGRKYGVSDNAVRKWLRWYEPPAEQADAA